MTASQPKVCATLHLLNIARTLTKLRAWLFPKHAQLRVHAHKSRAQQPVRWCASFSMAVCQGHAHAQGAASHLTARMCHLTQRHISAHQVAPGSFHVQAYMPVRVSARESCMHVCLCESVCFIQSRNPPPRFNDNTALDSHMAAVDAPAGNALDRNNINKRKVPEKVCVVPGAFCTHKRSQVAMNARGRTDVRRGWAASEARVCVYVCVYVCVCRLPASTQTWTVTRTVRSSAPRASVASSVAPHLFSTPSAARYTTTARATMLGFWTWAVILTYGVLPYMHVCAQGVEKAQAPAPAAPPAARPANTRSLFSGAVAKHTAGSQQVPSSLRTAGGSVQPSQGVSNLHRMPNVVIATQGDSGAVAAAKVPKASGRSGRTKSTLLPNAGKVRCYQHCVVPPCMLQAIQGCILHSKS